MKGTLIIDVGRCIGCARCELACAVEHSRTRELIGAVFERVPPLTRIVVKEHEGMPIPLLCIHCDDPACAAACPAAAIEKHPGGRVILAEDRCVGCGACAVACHLGIPTMRRDGRAYVKCDLCLSRAEEGKIPACAEACRAGAIVYKRSDEGGGPVVYEKSEEGRKLYARPARTR